MTTTHIGSDMEVAIIGGGIGGLAAAVALQAVGINAHVFEQTAILSEVGGAVVIREPSLALLDGWGLADAFRPAAVRFTEIEVRAANGDLLGSGPSGVEPGEADWAYSVYRADLHNLLRNALPAGSIHLGHRLSTVHEHKSHVEASFENGTRIQTNVLVGADGLRSVVRLLVDRTPLEFVNLVIFRSIAPAHVMPVELPNDRLRLWRGENRTILTLPLRGGRDIAIDSAFTDFTEAPPKDLWSSTIPTDELIQGFPGFDPRIIDAVRAGSPTASAHPVYDREPIPHWSTDRITLLGDAAHPMAPNRGQGANQAIQDAGVLADELQSATSQDTPLALQRYQDARAPHTAAIQTASRTAPDWQFSTTP